MGSHEECQRLRRQGSSYQRVCHLFENKRYTCELTKEHLCRMEVKWGGGERGKEETISGICLLFSKNGNELQKLGTRT